MMLGSLSFFLHFIPLSISLLSTPSKSGASMPHRWKRLFLTLLITPSTRPPRGLSASAQAPVHHCFNSILAQDKWGIGIFSARQRGGFICSKKRDSWAEFFHSCHIRRKNRKEESHTEKRGSPLPDCGLEHSNCWHMCYELALT